MRDQVRRCPRRFANFLRQVGSKLPDHGGSSLSHEMDLALVASITPELIESRERESTAVIALAALDDGCPPRVVRCALASLACAPPSARCSTAPSTSRSAASTCVLPVREVVLWNLYRNSPSLPLHQRRMGGMRVIYGASRPCKCRPRSRGRTARRGRTGATSVIGRRWLLSWKRLRKGRSG